jgi:hypothetical protein
MVRALAPSGSVPGEFTAVFIANRAHGFSAKGLFGIQK